MKDLGLGILTLAALLISAPFALAAAQPAPASGPPNALQGFSQNRDQPVKIDSATLEVRDKHKMATFSGNVHLVQGDTTLRCQRLIVFYEQDAKPGSAVATAGGSKNQQIKRIEAKGDVIVTQKDQTATGDNGLFEMKENKVMLTGNVVISQGPNVITGDRLVVDMTTGVSRVECDKAQCRVSALLQPGSIKDPKDAGNQPTDARKEVKDTRGQPAGGKEPPKTKPLSPSGLY